MAASQHESSPQSMSPNDVLFPIRISICMDFQHMEGEYATWFTVRFLEGTNARDLVVPQFFFIDIIAVLFGH